MKEPWQIFTDEYWRSRKSKGHDIAVMDAVAAVMFHVHGQRRPDYLALAGRLKLATDQWEAHDGANWDGLREKLRHEWTDHELSRQ